MNMLTNFIEFDLIRDHEITFNIYTETDNSDEIFISLNSHDDLWNGNKNKINSFFCKTISLNRDEWTKFKNYQNNEYSKYQKDFKNALVEFNSINKATEAKNQVNLYLIKLAMETLNK